MTVAVVLTGAQQNAGTNNGSTFTFTNFNVAGSSLLIVALVWTGGSNTPSSVTFNGTAMAAISGTTGQDNTGSGFGIYGMVSPPSGSNTLVVNGSQLGSNMNMTYYGLSGTGTTSVSGCIGAKGITLNSGSSTTSSTVTLSTSVSTSMILGFEFDESSNALSPSGGTGYTAGGTVSGNNVVSRSYYNGSPTAGASFTFTCSQASKLSTTAIEVLASGGAAQSLTASALTGTWAIGTTTVNEQVNVATVTSTYSIGAASVSTMQYVTAAALAASFVIGTLTTNLQVNNTQLAGTTSFGSATITTIQQLTAAPISMTSSIGSVTISRQVNVSTLTSSYTVPAYNVMLNITATSFAMTSFVGATIDSTEVDAGPFVVTSSLGVCNVSQQALGSPLSASYAFGAVVVNQNQSLTSAPLAGSFTIGSGALSQGLQVFGTPLTSTYTLSSAYLVYNQIVSASALTSTVASGSYSISQQVNVTSLTFVSSIGSSTGTLQINAGTVTATYAFGAVTLPLQVNAGTLMATYTIGVETTGEPTAPSITAVPLSSSYNIPAYAVVLTPPPSITSSTIVGTYTFGTSSLTYAQVINVTTLTITSSMGTETTTEPAALIITAASLTSTYATGANSVAAGVLPVITASPLSVTTSTGNVILVVPTPPVLTGAQFTMSSTLGSTVVAKVFGPVVAQFTISSTLGAAHVIVSQAPMFVQPFNMSSSVGAVSISVGTTPIPASYGIASFQVTMDAVSDGDRSLVWFTYDGTAVGNKDYIVASGTLTFPVGSSSQQIKVYYRHPSPGDQAKQFNVVLTSPFNVDIILGIATCNIPAGAGVTVVVASQSITATPVAMTSFIGSATIAIGGQLVTVASLTMSSTTGAISLTQSTAPMSYLTARGSLLFDAAGKQFVPKSINYYGFNQGFTLQGIDTRAYKSVGNGLPDTINEGILDQIKRMGFNSIRLYICEDITWSTTTHSPTGWTAANGTRPSTQSSTYVAYIDPDLNPDFFISGSSGNILYGVGGPQPVISSLEMLDKIVAYCQTIGLRIFGDMHCLAPNASDLLGNSNGQSAAGPTAGYPTPGYDFASKLWYTTSTPGATGSNAGTPGESRSEAQIIAAHVALAQRYLGQPAWAGHDLINEPAGGTWDNDPNTGLVGFYTRCGNAIQAVNPNVLIICEGACGRPTAANPTGNINFGNTPANEPQTYGPIWSGDLTGVATSPVTLNTPNKVVYSPHEYGSNPGDAYGYCPASFKTATGDKGYAHQWFFDPTFPANMPHIWDTEWGYIAKQGIAPVWIGECGSDLSIPGSGSFTANNMSADELWLTALAAYINTNDIGICIQSVNPETGPVGYLSQTTDGATISSSGTIWSFEPNSFQKPYYSLLLGPAAVPSAASLTATPLTMTVALGAAYFGAPPTPQSITSSALSGTFSIGTENIVVTPLSSGAMPVWYDTFYSFADVTSQYVSGATTPAALVANTRLSKIPNYCNKVLISFAQPNFTYTSGQINTLTAYQFQSNTGIQYADTPANMKAATDLLRVRNPHVKILLAVGGASYNMWSSPAYAAIALFVNEMGWDGVIIDYEPSTYNFGCTISGSSVSCTADSTLQAIVTAFRTALPRPKLLEIVGWSNGCYGLGSYNTQPSQYDAGSFINLASSSAGAALDAVHIASYDDDPNYDPYTALLSYLHYYSIPVYLTARARGASDSNNRDWSISYLTTLCGQITTLGGNAAGLGIYSMQEPPYPIQDNGSVPSAFSTPQPDTTSRPNPQDMATAIATAFNLPHPSIPLWNDAYTFVPY